MHRNSSEDERRPQDSIVYTPRAYRERTPEDDARVYTELDDVIHKPGTWSPSVNKGETR